MTDTRSSSKSLLGLPLPPPPLDGGGASEPLVTAEEGHARRDAREKDFKEHVVPHAARLIAYARSILRDEEDAETAVQDAMEDAWKVDAVETCGRDEDRIVPYLLKAVKNRAQNVLRARDRDRKLKDELSNHQLSRPNDAVPQSQAAECADILEAMNRALQEFSWIDREVWTLVRLLGFKPKEVAEALGINVNTLRVGINKVARHLSKELAPFRAPNAADDRKREDTL